MQIENYIFKITSPRGQWVKMDNKPLCRQVSESVIKFNGIFPTLDIKVYVIHIQAV